MIKTAVVFGWGAVERLAEIWQPGAQVEEIEARLWTVRTPGGRLLGLIGKENWSLDALRHRADALEKAEEEAESK